MVDGVLGYVDHVVSHVMVEHRFVLEDVIILHLSVEETTVLAQVLIDVHALSIIQVRSLNR